MPRARWVVLVCLVGCGMRAAAPIDVDRLLAARGPIEARRDLEIRITGDPRDVAGRLALAALDEQLGRPSEAIAALEAVEALGGPLGVRWHAVDQARLARLIAARGRVRLARGAATALADLERARRLGAEIRDDELAGARAAVALAALRHSDAETRDGGRRTLAELAAPGNEAWRGAQPGATAEQRGRFGAWLWDHGARRAAWDELSAWARTASEPRDPALRDAYLAAARWWIPSDSPGPPPAGLSGPLRCAFTACAPHEIAGDLPAERAYLAAPLPPPVRDPEDAAALVVITLRQALRGDAAWGPALAARIDLAALTEPGRLAAVPGYARPILARLIGREAPNADRGATADQRLAIGAARALAGASVAELTAAIGDVPGAAALIRVVEPAAVAPAGEPLAEAVARRAAQLVPELASADSIRAVAIGYRRDPAIADRLGRDAVAGAVDASAMQATLGAAFDALGDPARARAAWQAAVDASPEPAFLRGLAEAEARQGDGDAALVAATSAAAASGDPAVTWTSVARALAGSGRYVHALEAARSAIGLSGPETMAAALEAASAASRALGRDPQAARLAAQRARWVAEGHAIGPDPTDPDAALAAYQQRDPGEAPPALIDRMWLAARWNRRNVALRAALVAALVASDPRRGQLVGELVELAGDRDPEIGRAAVAALR